MYSMVPGFGKDFKYGLRKPGPWMFYIGAFGECLPYKDNRMELVENKKDRFGIPQVRFHFKFRENEEKMAADIVSQSKVMLEKAGLVNVTTFSKTSTGGDGIHEMGTARMGRDPSTSVLNEWNQVHSVPNVFVTDGSCMTSSSCVNPSITYMALTARAADYAVTQLRAGNV